MAESPFGLLGGMNVMLPLEEEPLLQDGTAGIPAATSEAETAFSNKPTTFVQDSSYLNSAPTSFQDEPSLLNGIGSGHAVETAPAPAKRPSTGGLAALVVRQTAPLPPRVSSAQLPKFQGQEFATPSYTPPHFEPVALGQPNFEKPSTSPHFMPKTAIAACLATAVLTPGELLSEPPLRMQEQASVPNSKVEAPPPAQVSEIEEMRSDLFGAVMGVSALKDRLDSLESLLLRLESAVNQHLTSPHEPPVTEQQVHQWLGEWLENHLDERLNEQLRKLTMTRYFRLGTGTANPTRTCTLTQAPVILDTTLS